MTYVVMLAALLVVLAPGEPGYRPRAPGLLQCPFRAAVRPCHHPGRRSADSVPGRGWGERRREKGHCGRLGRVRAAAQPPPRNWLAEAYEEARRLARPEPHMEMEKESADWPAVLHTLR